MTDVAKQVNVIRLELLGMEDYMRERADDQYEQYVKDWWSLNRDFLVYCMEQGMMESFLSRAGNKWSTWKPEDTQ